MRALAIIVAALVLFSSPSSSSRPVTSNVLLRVLKIGAENDTATAFTIDVDKRQYIVTAKHAVKQLSDNASIKIYNSNKWEDIDVKIFRCDDPIDIAILVPNMQI